MVKLTLPTDSNERKEIPILRGVMNYFPAALAGVARISVAGNNKHNKGQPLHHARGKSMDHGDCIIRHTMDLEDIKAQMYRGPYPPTDADKTALLEEARCRAWRALADLQELEEKYGGAPLAPAARPAEVLGIISKLSEKELFDLRQQPVGGMTLTQCPKGSVPHTVAECAPGAGRAHYPTDDGANATETQGAKAMRGRLEGEKIP